MTGRPSIRRAPFVAVGIVNLLVALLVGLKLRDNPYPTGQDLWGWRASSSSTMWRILDVPFLGHARSVVNDFAPVACPGSAIALGLGLFLAFRWMGRPRTAVFCLAAPALSLALAEWLGKPFFHRTLGSTLAYPSGHTTATVSAGFVIVLLAWRSGGLRRAALVGALWMIPAISMVLFLLIRRSHYPSDLVGGVGIGLGIPCLLAAALFGRHREASRATEYERTEHQRTEYERPR